MKYTKEQAQEVLKDWFAYKKCRPTTSNTYEKFIESKFPSLEVGKWYKDTSRRSNLLVYITDLKANEILGYGFGFDGCWLELDCWYRNNMPEANQELREATKEEVEAALIKEADRRGIWQVPINCVIGMKRLNRIYDTSYCMLDNILWSKYGRVFENGKWATPIVQDPTKEKLSELEDTIKKAQQEIQELKRLQK
jgi:hypothetical protein